MDILKLEREAGNLVRFLASGESFSVRTELQSIEAALQRLRVEMSDLEHQACVNLPRISELDSRTPRIPAGAGYAECYTVGASRPGSG